ncbi:MAG: 3-dehydroquinate synthase, partial [Ascidiaceihabitans sp.]
MRDVVSVNLPGREYDIHIGPGLLVDAGALISPFLSQPRVWIITDETVGALHLETLRAG